ncbi:MAG TPA: GDP-mannose 4,6-dehydratase [Candidatus Baltobacteraceae bacterium]|nr:GDP-mannose 4,6-dehydratase [Candidatus Baltobacteraceae bacterium]
MRALVTGASGFAGTHLTRALRERGSEVIAPDCDVRDTEAVTAAIVDARPEIVYHLAAQAFVPAAIADPDETYRINVRGTANVLAALRALQKQHAPARLLFVSSADAYGPQPPQAYPLREETLPRPANPYAASKLAAEALVQGEVRAYGLDAVITRAFNHIGPGQSDRFAAASFAKQLAGIAAGGEPVLLVGDLTAKRDFLDVRDVVQAYISLAERGVSGETYNVCSETAISMREVLGELIRIARVPVEVREDPARMRPSDVPLLYGSNEKLRAATGWSQQIPLRRTLQDVYLDAQMTLNR